MGLALIYDHSNVAINLIQNDASVNHKVYVKKKDETAKKADEEDEEEPQVDRYYHITKQINLFTKYFFRRLWLIIQFMEHLGSITLATNSSNNKFKQTSPKASIHSLG